MTSYDARARRRQPLAKSAVTEATRRRLIALGLGASTEEANAEYMRTLTAYYAARGC